MKPKLRNLSCVFVVILINYKTAFSQQNLFNIPSGDVTKKNKFFYQHQLNLYSTKFESKSHLVYGLGKGWDAGVNVVGKTFDVSPVWQFQHNSSSSHGALYPIVLGTIQKQIQMSDKFDLNVSGQAGANISAKLAHKQLNYFASCFAVYHIFKGSRIVGGVYKANNMFVGDGNTLGFIVGYELKLSKRFYLMGDWISGDNESSVGVLGAMYNIGKRIQVCAGWQLPNAYNSKPMGLVLELNLLGWDL